MYLRIILTALLLSVATQAQEGDHPGETQKLLVPREVIPPAPLLSPQEALATFRVPEGFRVELVACEPMIETPVAMQFDPQGRLWVLEMRGYMRTADGAGEDQPLGRVSVLEDTDGDGRMDRSVVFVDGLIMARAFLLVRNGLLVAEPPNLWFLRDTNGDGRADEKNLVADDYATQADPKLGKRANPEHSSNSLFWALDNWIYSANHTTRFRNAAGMWQREGTISRGQWGFSQDDYGRLFYNSNSDQLRGDLVPSHYLGRNPAFSGAVGASYRVASDQTVWPGRVNPGVNRGYQKGQLREDGTLRTFTGACGPVIYRGDQFPGEFYGNAFLCEPTGNLVRRNVLTETGNVIAATNAYDKSEFMTSSDERFRPVNLSNGPDGALYVVDIHRGIIQHRIYLTSYLRGQAADRGLEAPVDRGRIYRVVARGSARSGGKPSLATSTSAELVATLAHPNGWWRDTAHRLLVERGDRSSVAPLARVATDSDSAIGRIHALWTLDGLSALSPEVLGAAMESEHSRVRATAIRLSESFLGGQESVDLTARILKRLNDPAPEVQLQLALTLGELRSGESLSAMQTVLDGNPGNALVRDAILSGLNGRELEFLSLVSKVWSEESSWRSGVLKTLSRCVIAEGNGARLQQLFSVAQAQGSDSAWQQLSILDGVSEAAPRRNGKRAATPPNPILLDLQPPLLEGLAQSPDPKMRDRVERILSLITWPDKAALDDGVEVTPLTPEQVARFEQGRELYMTTCGACHQPHGNGQEGLAPPLRNSDWATGPEGRIVRVALQGVRGPINVNGKVYELDMPALGVLEDEQIADILTYIRREWGHTAAPVEQATVAKIRADTAERVDAWTEKELLAIP
jgi:mono/diheme cytochrome c family protein/glucose/arabinose dehydrogenase